MPKKEEEKKVTAAKKPAVEKKSTANKPAAAAVAADATAAKKNAASATAKAAPAAKKSASAIEATKAEPAKKIETKQVPPKKITAKKAAAAIAAPKKPRTGPLKILFAASECVPFAASGGLGEVIGSLPQALNANGCDARVILPLFECFPERFKDKLAFVTHIHVGVSWRNQYCGVFMLKNNGVTYYFIDNEYYFKRHGLYGHADEAERFAFFSRAVLDVLPYIDFKPDIIHANDWQTALVPVYYKLYYQNRPEFEDIKIAYTVHNIEYQGKFDYTIVEDVLGIPNSEYPSIEWGGGVNLMKAALDYCDYISTVSPSYASELKYAFFAHGLEDIIVKNSHKMRGILNGINLDIWNPRSDKSLFCEFSEKQIAGKAENKKELQAMLSLPERPHTPLIALITRLVSHKGMDILKLATNELLKRDIQLVVLGTGDREYENFFEFLTDVYPDKIHAVIDYNTDLAHKIYGGADIFLMPSKSEPCGLSQMIAARYATVPVVRATGGLKDSITDCNNGDFGIGFVFENYDMWDLLHAIDRAVGLYKDYPEKWNALRLRAMKAEFSWDKSAVEYIKMYKHILGE